MPFFPAVSGVPRIRYNLSGLSGPRRRADTALVGFSQSLPVAHAGRRGHRPPARVGVTLTDRYRRARAPLEHRLLPRRLAAGPWPRAQRTLRTPGRGFSRHTTRYGACLLLYYRRLLGELLGTYRDMPVWRGCDLRGGSTARAACGVRVPALFDAPYGPRLKALCSFVYSRGST